MSHYKVNTSDIFFILKEQLRYGDLCKLERYRGLNEKALDMVVQEAIALAKGRLAPLQEIGDRQGVTFEGGKVSCPTAFREVFKEFGEGGWVAVSRDPRYGGMGFPHMMRIVVNDFMYGACQAFNMCSSLTHGAAHLIETFATDDLKERFVPKMYGGRWSGTMSLTEPDAGSDLGAIQTTAFREESRFRIKGSKIFISWGEHDLAENIIHLVLARVEGAPQGTRGLSLFIVPKRRLNPDGSPGEANDVLCTRVEEKLGLHGSPTCALSFGAGDRCEAYLCGEENRGLAHMFQMMNAARINSGVSGMTLGSTAYQNALSYARERVQGADLAGEASGPVPIIQHPDVRRMLLWMKTMVDGMRSMIYSGAFWSDLAWELPAGQEKAHYQNLTDFMTPIIKAYCSEMGFRVCEMAIQCLGGYGYCKDYPLEQYLRDVKIMSLYEGTTGIQSMDLLGRKMRVGNGAPYRAYTRALQNFLDTHEAHPALRVEVQDLANAAGKLSRAARILREMRASDPRRWGSRTYPALRCFGELTMAWRLLDMALAAERAIKQGKKTDFYRGKILQARYFVREILPLTRARLEACIRGGKEIVDMPPEAF
jgi:alkylation response protein AidB-like acyl-CoA dehydrogenase